MAVRLSLKVGLVTERDRVADSPDTVVRREPTVGAESRTKGSLYLLVTSTFPGPKAREATRLAAETIEHEYYYDESAGIRACLQKVISLANKRLAHQRDRLGMSGSDVVGPVGIALAVVRGSELYVATVGPAEAYLVRGARLSTLPDPHRDRGLPGADIMPDVWRGEMSVGDSLVLVSPSIVERLGPDELKDALVTLHPQSAIEHLHHRFVVEGGTGSDGAIAFEATEVSATQRQRTLVPVRPAEPLAGVPDRSPIPLADSVSDGVVAMSVGARQARDAAGGAFGGAVRSIQDRLPHRPAPKGRVTPLATRTEMRRRAAVALLAFVVFAGGLGFAVWLAGGSGTKGDVASLSAGERALEAARADVDEVWAPGVDLLKGDPGQAKTLLTDAYRQLAAAQAAGIPTTTIVPVRARVVSGLDTLFGVVLIRPSTMFTFPAGKTPVDLVAVVQGPDRKPYVIDRGSESVIRVDPTAGTTKVILQGGAKTLGTTVGTPRFLSVAGRDLLILDSSNILWRWTPANSKGAGTLAKVRVREAAGWGNDIRGMSTFCIRSDCSLYNLYVIDPSAKQILVYASAADGSGYSGNGTGRLATAQDVSGFDQMVIDGDIWILDGSSIERYVNGRNTGWAPEDPGDGLLRPAPAFSVIAATPDMGRGTMYGYDRPNGRVIAYAKIGGGYVEQYRPESGPPWTDVRAMYVIPGVGDGPDTLVWAERDTIKSTLLEAPLAPGATPSPGPSASAVASGSTRPSATPKASATP
jgi:hypothetical protein